MVTLADMKILVTGGAGYIGSTTAKALEAAGHVPVVLDSLLTILNASQAVRQIIYGLIVLALAAIYARATAAE